MTGARTRILHITGSGRSGTNVLGQANGFCFVGEAMYGGPEPGHPALCVRRSAPRLPILACYPPRCGRRPTLLTNASAELFLRRAPGRYLRLRYEDFVARPRESLDASCAWPASVPSKCPSPARALAVAHSYLQELAES